MYEGVSRRFFLIHFLHQSLFFVFPFNSFISMKCVEGLIYLFVMFDLHGKMDPKKYLKQKHHYLNHTIDVICDHTCSMKHCCDTILPG